MATWHCQLGHVALAGITAKPRPSRASSCMTPQGNPTGALKDAAWTKTLQDRAALSHDARLRQSSGPAHAASLGVTSVQHMNPEYADIAVYSSCRAGRTDHRIIALIPGSISGEIGVRTAFGSPFFASGPSSLRRRSLGSSTAISSNRSANRQIIVTALRRNAPHITECGSHDEATPRIAICTHAIATRDSIILDMYSESSKPTARVIRRFALKCATHGAKDFDRFAQLHVIAFDAALPCH